MNKREFYDRLEQSAFINSLDNCCRIETNLSNLIDQIFNDHEAQLKAKDEEIERLKGKTQILEVLVDNTKDIIEAQTRMCKTKARSIVAMLFWEWRKSEARIYATNIKWKTGRAFQSQILFETAYKILKKQQ